MRDRSVRSIFSRRTLKKQVFGFSQNRGPDGNAIASDDRNDDLGKARHCFVWVNPDRSGRFGRVSKVFASPGGPRATTTRPGANVISGAVRAVMESFSVAVHM